MSYTEKTDISISTYTVIVKLSDEDVNYDIDLHLISRFLPIYDEDAPETKGIDGCIIGINNYTEHNYTDIPRGVINEKNKYPSTVFNNELSIIYKYYDFKRINIKIFTNAKIHLTGIKDFEWEVNHVSNYIIDIFKNLKYQIYDKKDLENIKKFDYVICYSETGDLEYYRRNIDYYNIQNYIEKKNYNAEYKWLSNNEITTIINNYITYVEKHQEQINNIYNQIITNENFTLQIREEIYNKLRFYNKLKVIREKVKYLLDDKFKEFIIHHIKYLNNIFKKYIIRINNLIYTDNKIIDKFKSLYPKYLESFKTMNNIKSFNMEINSNDYKIGNINTELIKGEFNTGFGHILVNISNLLSSPKYNIFNTYTPDDGHAGVVITFHYNEKYLDKLPGNCFCDNFCKKSKKKAEGRCTTMTIFVFRPGSITITAAKTVEQLKYAYDFINQFIIDNFDEVCYKLPLNENGENEIQENLMKKIIKKNPMFINRESIIYS